MKQKMLVDSYGRRASSAILRGAYKLEEGCLANVSVAWKITAGTHGDGALWYNNTTIKESYV